MKTTTTLTSFGLALIFSLCGCADIGPRKHHQNSDPSIKSADHKLDLTHQKIPQPPPHNPHDTHRLVNKITTKGGGGFAAKVKKDKVVEWSNPDEPNFAIVLPSKDNWQLEQGFNWTTIPSQGNLPAVVTSSGSIRLRFLPTKGKEDDEFHYRLIYFNGRNMQLKGNSGRSILSSTAEDFPPDSDEDIVDATIIWDGDRTGDERHAK